MCLRAWGLVMDNAVDDYPPTKTSKRLRRLHRSARHAERATGFGALILLGFRSERGPAQLVRPDRNDESEPINR